jgi:hypothetical protein
MTPTTAAPGLILALDLGKYKSVACLYHGDPNNARFDSFTTDRQHLRQLFARHNPTVVVIEACAAGAGGVVGGPKPVGANFLATPSRTIASSSYPGY